MSHAQFHASLSHKLENFPFLEEGGKRKPSTEHQKALMPLAHHGPNQGVAGRPAGRGSSAGWRPGLAERKKADWLTGPLSPPPREWGPLRRSRRPGPQLRHDVDVLRDLLRDGRPPDVDGPGPGVPRRVHQVILPGARDEAVHLRPGGEGGPARWGSEAGEEVLWGVLWGLQAYVALVQS